MRLDMSRPVWVPFGSISSVCPHSAAAPCCAQWPFQQCLVCMLIRAPTSCRVVSSHGPFQQHLENKGEYGHVENMQHQQSPCPGMPRTTPPHCLLPCLPGC